MSRIDRLPGGLGDKLQPEDVDAEQLREGIAVEMEHTDDPELAREIALDHLAEDPRYYEKLRKIEQHEVRLAPPRDKSFVIGDEFWAVLDEVHEDLQARRSRLVGEMTAWRSGLRLSSR